MKITQCDRCGGEVSSAIKVGLAKVVMIGDLGPYDICENCFRDLKNFMSTPSIQGAEEGRGK